MITIKTDRKKISRYLKTTVTVSSDMKITAYEARATKNSMPYGMGIGYNLLGDDVSLTDGIVIPAMPVTSFSFDVEFSELGSDGDYRISIFVRNEDGIWNYCCLLYTSDSEKITDANGAYILAKRNGQGTDELYTSVFSGKDINDFVTEVLK